MRKKMKLGLWAVKVSKIVQMQSASLSWYISIFSYISILSIQTEVKYSYAHTQKVKQKENLSAEYAYEDGNAGNNGLNRYAL